MVYLLEKYEYEYKSKLTGYESCEGQIIDIKKGNILNKGINPVNIYRPPNNLVKNVISSLKNFHLKLKSLNPIKMKQLLEVILIWICVN